MKIGDNVLIKDFTSKLYKICKITENTETGYYLNDYERQIDFWINKYHIICQVDKTIAELLYE